MKCGLQVKSACFIVLLPGWFVDEIGYYGEAAVVETLMYASICFLKKHTSDLMGRLQKLAMGSFRISVPC